ncbi:hypothetical protein GH714_016605 [Hevea brasiliensis]|uniref:Uncharacterized protein n=1 Tax=Hevea brasiliensis TaxID=3981 RepID=A0A6A6L3C9_HEVBR|nr:hypothetical protein GH714_016605 [Hevea brasiliensis]
MLPDHEAMVVGCVAELTRTTSDSSSLTGDTSRDFSLHNASSIQFMVLQDGFWKKSNSKRNKPLLESTADSQFIQKNPWISHFTSAGKRCIAACHDREHCVPSTGRVRAGRSSPAFYGSTRPSQLDPACSLCHHNSVSIAIELFCYAMLMTVMETRLLIKVTQPRFPAEVSDQNFVDDEQGEKSSSVAVVKRLKVAEADASSKDQVIYRMNLYLYA